MRAVIGDGGFKLAQGDARELAKKLKEDSVDCIVTSPPYYGLRDYGTAQWSGGDDQCRHDEARKKTRYDYALGTSTKQMGRGTGTDAQPAMWKSSCPTCGAVRVDTQIGQEETVEEYIATLVALFRTLKRACTDHCTVWVNIGDSYCKGQLRGVPWKFALQMQSDGWILRRDIIWSKPDPMTESIKGRPTTSHEYVFLFTQGDKHYYDWYAVREKATRVPDGMVGDERLLRSVWVIPTASYSDIHFATFPPKLPRLCIQAGCARQVCTECGKPRRRIVDSTSLNRHDLPAGHPERRPARYDSGKAGDPQAPGPGQRFILASHSGWTDCGCKAPFRPGRVLDPFLGSGTTAWVARDLGLHCVGFELSDEYVGLIQQRTAQYSLLDLEVSV